MDSIWRYERQGEGSNPSGSTNLPDRLIGRALGFDPRRFISRVGSSPTPAANGRVAKLVHAAVLETVSFGTRGSTPLLATKWGCGEMVHAAGLNSVS